MSTSAVRSLANALELAESDLHLVLEHRDLLLPQSLHQGVLDVWPIIKQRFAELRTTLLEAPDSVDERLAAAGLTGVELEMKLNAHRAASEKAHLARTPRAPQTPIGFRKVFRSLLGWINVWLGSLVAAIGAGEGIKEFKEYLEQGVDDAENFS